MSNGTSQLSRIDTIENKIDRVAVSTIGVNAQRGMAVESMGQALEVAKLMAVSGQAVRAHLRGNPGACLALAIQAFEWGMNPYAIANKSYVVNDQVAYESALYQAVLSRRAPIKGRLKVEYDGEGPTRTCRVWAELNDGSGIVDYTSPKFGNIKPKNSPLWVNDPDQQLYYFSVRSFARRHFADVMMGIYTVDELEDAGEIAAPPVARLNARLVAHPTDDNRVIDTAPEMNTTPADESDAGSDLDSQVSHTEPEPPPAKDYAASWAETYERLNEIAMSRGIEPPKLSKTIDTHCLKYRCKGSPEKLTEDQRRELLALVDGE